MVRSSPHFSQPRSKPLPTIESTVVGSVRYPHAEIDPITEWSREPTPIALDRLWRAATFPRGIASVPTGTGIHRRGEHEAGGKDGGPGGARDPDGAFLEWLSQRVEHVSREFRGLVEEEHAVVRETDLAGPRAGAAADECHIGGGVMRGPEGWGGQQTRTRGQEPRDRMDGGDLERVVKGERRQDAGQTDGPAYSCRRRAGRRRAGCGRRRR